MDDGSPSEGGFWSSLMSLFKQKNGQHSLQSLIKAARDHGELGAGDGAMLLNVLRLGEKTVYEIMVPRTDIVCADIEDGIDEVSRLIVEQGHSRIPIYKGDKDNIIGVIHAKDLLISMLRPGDHPVTPAEIMRKPLFVPENKIVREMLFEFLNSRVHLAVALDEYGGTSGLLTLEDVLEQIVGDIEDEYDVDEPDEVQSLSDGTFLLSGRLSLEDLNEAFGTRLSSEQVETIGGLLCELSGRVPKQGEIFTLDGARYTVKDADKKQIRWIHMQPAESTAQP